MFGLGDPVPAAEPLDAGWISVKLGEERLDISDLVGQGGIDAPFDAAADLFEQPLGRVQLWAVGWQLHQGEVQRLDGRVAVARGAIPDEGIERGVRAQRFEDRNQIERLHRIDPGPGHRASLAIDRREQVPPVVAQLEALVYLHPASPPDPTRRPAQPESQFIGEADPTRTGQADGTEGCGEPPFFHLACASWSVFSWTGRGTFGAHCIRPSSEYIPPSV